ncbi:4,5-epoxidase [Tamaricihabitans halophyticus]|uniref:4,5-epoxidase n=1 Tax=Tamaricihabitans halophyticus TaxID=1262583 RepID=A0A4R2R3S7_9PSEU|nr:FAD-dependent oxidoreductase [Tamaricihabitans halophyticus]TCP57500.1 4,5-epoxidase [Tamaricihabitans halophyticus]
MTEVLVVGAGPTGLTLACGLAAHGVDVRVLDRAEGPAQTSRANILHARGVEVLRRIGALGELPERSLAPVGIRMHVGDKPISTMRFAPDARESVQALFISQAAVEAELRTRLHDLGVRVEWDNAVRAGHQDATGVTVELENGDTIRANWLAGCDGAHSEVRGLSGIPFPGVSVVEQFLLADVHGEWARDRSMSSGWFHRDGMLLAMPMRTQDGQADDLWRLMADVPMSDRRLSSEDIIARFDKLIPQRSGREGPRISDVVWTSVFRIQRRLVDDYRRGRILLAGDAAHIHSPIGGQGMNTGIGDAENLAWKLALVVRGSAPESLLDTYTAERRPLATEVLRNTTRNTRMLLGENALARVARDRMFVPLLNLPALQRKATRVASQLWVSYRNGPLGGGRGRLRLGDRVPDRACRRTDGAHTRLSDELGPEWAVLASKGEVAEELAQLASEHLAGPVVALVHNSVPAATAWLIRPDGHLAWRGQQPTELRGWLAEKLPAGAAKPAREESHGQ